MNLRPVPMTSTALNCRSVCLWRLTMLELVLVAGLAGPALAQNAPLPTLLTNAEQIVTASNHIVEGRYQARFQGVIIYVSPPTRRLYVQADPDRAGHFGLREPSRLGILSKGNPSAGLLARE